MLEGELWFLGVGCVGECFLVLSVGDVEVHAVFEAVVGGTLIHESTLCFNFLKLRYLIYKYAMNDV